MTLLEMLIAMTITLMMIGAVVTVFANVSQSISTNRAELELLEQLRNARLLLQQDLSQGTAPTTPWLKSDLVAGYFEYHEGHERDTTDYTDRLREGFNGDAPLPGDLVPASLLGDHDDIIAFTARAHEQDFVGFNGGYRDLGGTVRTEGFRSEYAEIIWWADYIKPDPINPTAPHPVLCLMRTVHRRVLLVCPWMQSVMSPSEFTVADAATLDDYWQNGADALWEFQSKYDLSARLVKVDGGGAHGFTLTIRLNRMEDLTNRQARFRHCWAYPHEFPDLRDDGLNPSLSINNPLMRLRPFPPDSVRFGEDVVLRNVLAWDVRAWDPRAPIRVVPGTTTHLTPGDHGWSSGTPATDIHPTKGSIPVQGAFVDLNYNPIDLPVAPMSDFSGKTFEANDPTHPFQSIVSTNWDTWPFEYEHDGEDQDDNRIIDDGTNGLDDPSTSGADNGFDQNGGVGGYGELETRPPYKAPLRAIQAQFRLYNPATRSVRQTTVVHSFVQQ